MNARGADFVVVMIATGLIAWPVLSLVELARAWRKWHNRRRPNGD